MAFSSVALASAERKCAAMSPGCNSLVFSDGNATAVWSREEVVSVCVSCSTFLRGVLRFVVLGAEGASSSNCVKVAASAFLAEVFRRPFWVEVGCREGDSVRRNAISGEDNASPQFVQVSVISKCNSPHAGQSIVCILSLFIRQPKHILYSTTNVSKNRVSKNSILIFKNIDISQYFPGSAARFLLKNALDGRCHSLCLLASSLFTCPSHTIQISRKVDQGG